MAVDYPARAAQVARIIAHAGQANEKTGLFSWTPPGATAVSFPATILEDKRDASDAMRDDSGENTVRVIVAASALAALTSAFPRVGQHFTDAAGRSYRIGKVLSPPYSPTAAFRCGNVV